MKALVYTAPETLDWREAPDPAPREDEHLVRIEAVGICGSDMHAWAGHDDRRPAPLILGHEGAGVIEGGPRDGERVTINPLVTCGTCPACAAGRENICADRQIISMPPREGAFAQYVAMPAKNLVTVPDGVPASKAALAEPLAVSWHAVRLGMDLLQDRRDSALVLGGGAIGVAAALALAARGVPHIVVSEPNPLRRARLASEPGFRSVGAGEVAGMFDLVVDAVGIDATRAAACHHARPGGAILHVGLGGGAGGLDIRRLTLQEIAFLGTYTYTAQDFRDTAAALFDGRLGALDWTEARPLAEGARAFDDIRAGRVAAPKIVLHP